MPRSFNVCFKTQKTNLGDSSQNYATSAAQIFSINPEAQSGLYWIKGRSTGMTYPAQIWCDFDHLGGGWMLTHAHKCIDNEGVYEDTFTSKLGTPSSNVSSSGADWQGATDSNSGSFTGYTWSAQKSTSQGFGTAALDAGALASGGVALTFRFRAKDSGGNVIATSGLSNSETIYVAGTRSFGGGGGGGFEP